MLQPAPKWRFVAGQPATQPVLALVFLIDRPSADRCRATTRENELVLLPTPVDADNVP